MGPHLCRCVAKASATLDTARGAPFSATRATRPSLSSCCMCCSVTSPLQSFNHCSSLINGPSNVGDKLGIHQCQKSRLQHDPHQQLQRTRWRLHFQVCASQKTAAQYSCNHQNLERLRLTQLPAVAARTCAMGLSKHGDQTQAPSCEMPTAHCRIPATVLGGAAPAKLLKMSCSNTSVRVPRGNLTYRMTTVDA